MEQFSETEVVVADAAYKTPHICKKEFDDGSVLFTACKRPQTMKGGHEWWKYVYDEFYDCVICPEYQPLKYHTTNRDGYREYNSTPQYAPTARLESDAPIPKTVSRQCSGISGRTTKNWQTMPDIHRSTKRLTRSVKRRLNGSLRTPKKNTRCVIRSTEA